VKVAVITGLLLLGLTSSARADDWSGWLMQLFGLGGIYSFEGYLACTNPHGLGGCLANGTHFVTRSGISEIECRALINSARAAGGSGGVCIPPLK
jgi:hypothetical protein